MAAWRDNWPSEFSRQDQPLDNQPRTVNMFRDDYLRLPRTPRQAQFSVSHGTRRLRTTTRSQSPRSAMAAGRVQTNEGSLRGASVDRSSREPLKKSVARSKPKRHRKAASLARQALMVGSWCGRPSDEPNPKCHERILWTESAQVFLAEHLMPPASWTANAATSNRPRPAIRGWQRPTKV